MLTQAMMNTLYATLFGHCPELFILQSVLNRSVGILNFPRQAIYNYQQKESLISLTQSILIKGMFATKSLKLFDFVF